MEDKNNLTIKENDLIEEEIQLTLFLISRGWERIFNPDGEIFGWRHKKEKNPLAIMSAPKAKLIEDRKLNNKGMVIEVEFKSKKKT